MVEHRCSKTRLVPSSNVGDRCNLSLSLWRRGFRYHELIDQLADRAELDVYAMNWWHGPRARLTRRRRLTVPNAELAMARLSWPTLRQTVEPKRAPMRSRRAEQGERRNHVGPSSFLGNVAVEAFGL
jgi:hypothetical protein